MKACRSTSPARRRHVAGTGLACATLLILAPCLAPALAPDDVSEAAGWTRYRFEKSRFSVRLPQPPERAERSRSTPVGTLYEAHYTVEADGLRLIVEHYQLPAIAEVAVEHAGGAAHDHE